MTDLPFTALLMLDCIRHVLTTIVQGIISVKYLDSDDVFCSGCERFITFTNITCFQDYPHTNSSTTSFNSYPLFQNLMFC